MKNRSSMQSTPKIKVALVGTNQRNLSCLWRPQAREEAGVGWSLWSNPKTLSHLLVEKVRSFIPTAKTKSSPEMQKQSNMHLIHPTPSGLSTSRDKRMLQVHKFRNHLQTVTSTSRTHSTAITVPITPPVGGECQCTQMMTKIQAPTRIEESSPARMIPWLTASRWHF